MSERRANPGRRASDRVEFTRKIVLIFMGSYGAVWAILAVGAWQFLQYVENNDRRVCETVRVLAVNQAKFIRELETAGDLPAGAAGDRLLDLRVSAEKLAPLCPRPRPRPRAPRS